VDERPQAVPNRGAAAPEHLRGEGARRIIDEPVAKLRRSEV